MPSPRLTRRMERHQVTRGHGVRGSSDCRREHLMNVSDCVWSVGRGAVGPAVGGGARWVSPDGAGSLAAKAGSGGSWPCGLGLRTQVMELGIVMGLGRAMRSADTVGEECLVALGGTKVERSRKI